MIDDTDEIFMQISHAATISGMPWSDVKVYQRVSGNQTIKHQQLQEL